MGTGVVAPPPVEVQVATAISAQVEAERMKEVAETATIAAVQAKDDRMLAEAKRRQWEAEMAAVNAAKAAAEAAASATIAATAKAAELQAEGAAMQPPPADTTLVSHSQPTDAAVADSGIPWAKLAVAGIIFKILWA